MSADRSTGKNRPDPDRRKAPKCVTIFGGGVAGLTAAHELVERNFRVQVWEPNVDPRAPDGGPDVGGMARTQWARVPWGETKVLGQAEEQPKAEEQRDWKPLQTANIVPLPLIIYSTLDDTGGEVAAPAFAFGPQGVASPEDAMFDVLELLRKTPTIEAVYCEIQRRLARNQDLDEAAVDQGVQYFRNLIEKVSQRAEGRSSLPPPGPCKTDYSWQRYVKLHLHESQDPSSKSRDINVYIVPLDGFPEDAPPEFTYRVAFRVRERWLPGEHGFRFFPSFYKHVFDTMNRTPILEPVAKSLVGAAQERSVTVNAQGERLVETGRTAFDNLRSLSQTAFGLQAGQPPVVLSRFAPASMEQIRGWLRLFFGKAADQGDRSGDSSTKPTEPGPYGLGCTARDAARFELKVLQYLTSCEERRGDYEQMTWLQFLGGTDAYSPAFVKMVEAWPEALVAMDAKTIDARSHGSALMQFMLDNMRPPGYRDGTLVGPTSDAWFKPWRTYLEAQGVEFISGKLKGFTSVNVETDGKNARIVWPDVECYEPRYPVATESDGTRSRGAQPGLMPGYFVLALPVIEAKAMAQAYITAKEGAGLGTVDEGSDLSLLARLPLPADPNVPKPDGQLRHMIGIQYYFDEDISWLDGHVVFLNSEWRVSGISQDHFWRDRPDWEHGYRGILSTIFSVTTDGEPNDSWGIPPEKIAANVWTQASRDLLKVPNPVAWHIDDGFKWDERMVWFGTNKQGQLERKTGGYTNDTPYQINLPGLWESRPGKLPLSRDLKPWDGYEVEDGIVLAGTYTKTYTRITSMEAANESARHAVNGILHDVQKTTHEEQSYCSIWPLEDREVDDFCILKELDQELYRRGLDHFVEILELDELSAHVLRGGARDPFDMMGALRGIGRLLRDEFPL
jgi:hypothetical protein